MSRLELDAIREELADLYRRQADAEAADLEGRVTDRYLWRAQIDERAEWIRRLELRRHQLEREER